MVELRGTSLFVKDCVQFEHPQHGLTFGSIMKFFKLVSIMLHIHVLVLHNVMGCIIMLYAIHIIGWSCGISCHHSLSVDSVTVY